MYFHITPGRNGGIGNIVTAMHIKRVAIGISQNKVIPRLITATRGTSYPGDAVPVPVKDIRLYKRVGSRFNSNTIP